jgi:hypothetical protein
VSNLWGALEVYKIEFREAAVLDVGITRWTRSLETVLEVYKIEFREAVILDLGITHQTRGLATVANP